MNFRLVILSTLLGFLSLGSVAQDDEIFRIKPLFDEVTLRNMALAAKPPQQPDTLLEPELVELIALDSTIKYDIRYATTRNFMGMKFYKQPRALMQKPAADALLQVSEKLREDGFGLIIYDAYRPWYVTKMFWDATPDSLKDYVANPANGSRHNRGCAVDLGLYDLASGEIVPMPSGYDEFTEKAHSNYMNASTEEIQNRQILRKAMEASGFKVYSFEWWHFDYKDWQKYPVLNIKFEDLN